MKLLKKTVLATLLSAPLCASATTYVFADCATGAAGGCIAGSDGAAGTTSAPWQTLTKFRNTLASAVAGDQLLLCKGSAWTNWNVTTLPTGDTIANLKANPIIIDSVACSTFTSSAKPLLKTRTKKADNTTDCEFNDTRECSAFEWANGTGSTYRGGVIVRNLAIDGANAPATSALSVYGSMAYVKSENLTITNVASALGISSDPNTANPVHDIRYAGSNINGTLGTAIACFGSFNDVTIENNIIDNAANASKGWTAKAGDHPIYCSGNFNGNNTSVNSNVVIRGNRLTNFCKNVNDLGDTTKSGCAAIVAHDRMYRWSFEYNWIETPLGKSFGQNYGIQISPGNGAPEVESEDRIEIIGNTIINPGNVGIEIASMSNGLIYNNVIVQNNPWDGFYAIQMINSPWSSVTNQANWIFNNSMFLQQGTGTGAFLRLLDEGTQHVVANNLMKVGSGGPGGSFSCYETNLSAAAFTYWDRNLCHNTTNWTASYANRSAFATARSQDTNASSSDPLLVATPTSPNYSLQVQSGSPARGLSSTTYVPRLSRLGYVRSDKTAGASEYGADPY